ncbi:B12-binding domain-containing radical SAM protein [Oxobacter pfennigii]|uniref:B12-binding domain-containing radical SAM protein n=1 Tax=Oxobacter pfennigii TaxID=36849 RepID=UPI0006D406A6|nr:radical SAM protein [Oxobacter pfennigii]
MKILLVRPKNLKGMGVLEFVNVEPLELEYLAAICTELQAQYEIYDGSIEKIKFEDKYSNFSYDAVAISGYINSVDKIKNYAKYIKSRNPNAKVIVGGVVAEVVPEYFYCPHIDIIVHSGGFKPFKDLLSCGFSPDFYKDMPGICYKLSGSFIKNEQCIFNVNELPIPDRSHFFKNKDMFHYLNYKPVATMKTSYSCPYKCNFCYCKKLNNGTFISMDLDKIIEEIKVINCHTIWITDDVFLFDRQRLINFAHEIKSQAITKSFIVYSRADFIVNNSDLLPLMKKAGIVMVIVGLEAVEDKNLDNFNKGTDKEINRECVRLLQINGIDCTGLFIAGIDYTRKDFWNLRKWIEESGLKIYTVSIFTPLPGTETYEQYKSEIKDNNLSKFDFLHLHIKPQNMSKTSFYMEFIKLHIPYVKNFLKEYTHKFKKGLKTR